MEEQVPRYRICSERNVAAAFERFHSRPRWIRPASTAYCGALDALARLRAYFARKALISSMRN